MNSAQQPFWGYVGGQDWSLKWSCVLRTSMSKSRRSSIWDDREKILTYSSVSHTFGSCGICCQNSLWRISSLMGDKVLSETSLMILQQSCLIILQPCFGRYGPRSAMLHMCTGWRWGKVKRQLAEVFCTQSPSLLQAGNELWEQLRSLRYEQHQV